MPSPVATSNGTSGGTGQTTDTAKNTSLGVIPFRRATREHRELVADTTYTMSASTQQPPNGMIGIPAYGYLRGIMLTVKISGGAGGTPALTEDSPFNVLQNIIVSEPNGAAIAQFNSGYELFLANKYGGIQPGFYTDPKAGIYSSAANLANGQFQLYIPFEIDPRSGLGSLPNQNAAANFQLRYQVAGSGTLYSTAPTTLPTVEVIVEAYEYDQPAGSSDMGQNQTRPPAMNTTQFWTVQPYSVVAGPNRIRLTRVGNYLRNLGFIYRAATRAAGETNWPNPLELDLDARPWDNIRQLTWKQQMYRHTGFSAGTLDSAGNQDSGVYWYDLTHEFDGSTGYENRDGWIRTLGSTRLEVYGNFAAAGTLTVITNDVAVAGNVFLG